MWANGAPDPSGASPGWRPKLTGIDRNAMDTTGTSVMMTSRAYEAGQELAKIVLHGKSLHLKP